MTNLLFPLKLLSGANHKKEKDMGARNISKKRAWVREIFQKKGHGCEKYFKKKGMGVRNISKKKNRKGNLPEFIAGDTCQ